VTEQTNEKPPNPLKTGGGNNVGLYIGIFAVSLYFILNALL